MAHQLQQFNKKLQRYLCRCHDLSTCVCRPTVLTYSCKISLRASSFFVLKYTNEYQCRRPAKQHGPGNRIHNQFTRDARNMRRQHWQDLAPGQTVKEIRSQQPIQKHSLTDRFQPCKHCSSLDYSCDIWSVDRCAQHVISQLTPQIRCIVFAPRLSRPLFQSY